MPRRGENIYKRKDGRWEGRQQKSTGKYQYFYGKSYREVKEKMRFFIENNKLSDDAPGSSTPNAVELFCNWLECEAVNRVKPSTYESYYNCLNKYIIPFYSKNHCEEITEGSVTLFVKEMKEETSISDAYKKKILAVFKTALKEILINHNDSSIILQAVKLPKTEQKEVEIFTMKEQRSIEWAAINYEDKRALGIILCIYTGIRLGELCALRWSDFDLDAATMSIKRTVTRTKNFNKQESKTLLNVGTPKSRTSIRKIPLPAFLVTIAKDYILTGDKEDYYILSGSNAPIDPRAYQKLYKRVLKRAGVKDRKFHSTRHTFATRALELHVDIKTVSEILGHSNVAITMNVYAHSLMEQKKIAIDKFNDMHLTSMKQHTFAVESSVITA
ncbi:tyrosine-type recombinase/integrase [Lacrimispora aerotolerans]|uniref:tyrosine-type recombinase/integrase n=1 Tax=Lacrimispora aerotolerans TaxID=36832 RepID=UPI0004797CE7|nr:site-specific integrase [Lacrimispora aerotolerans]